MQQTKSQKSKQKQNEPLAFDPLRRTAKGIVDLIDEPEDFLRFLLESLQYISMEDYTGEYQDPSIEFTHLIELVYVPWAKGGPKMIDNIEAGLEKIYGWYGDVFPKALAGFFRAYSKIILEGGGAGKDLMIGTRGITALMIINNTFRERWEIERNEKAEKN